MGLGQEIKRPREKALVSLRTGPVGIGEEGGIQRSLSTRPLGLAQPKDIQRTGGFQAIAATPRVTVSACLESLPSSPPWVLSYLADKTC